MIICILGGKRFSSRVVVVHVQINARSRFDMSHLI